MSKNQKDLYVDFIMDLVNEVDNWLHENYPFIAKFGSSDSIIAGIKKQSEIAANLGEQNVTKDDPLIPHDKIDEYLNESGTYNHINKNHGNCEKMKELLIDELRAKVKTLSKVFEGQGESYCELVKSALKDRKTAEEYLFLEYEIRKKQLQLIRMDSKLLDIPFFARGKALEIIESVLQKEKELFKKRILES